MLFQTNRTIDTSGNFNFESFRKGESTSVKELMMKRAEGETIKVEPNRVASKRAVAQLDLTEGVAKDYRDKSFEQELTEETENNPVGVLASGCNDTHFLTPEESAAIDEAIRSLEAGKGIPASEVRQRFAVISSTNSQIALDEPGTEQLVGRGDLLCNNGRGLVRAQSYFIPQPEFLKLCLNNG